MRTSAFWLSPSLPLALLALLGCGGDDRSVGAVPGSAGSAGSGVAGSPGEAGTAGSHGEAGAGGAGGGAMGAAGQGGAPPLAVEPELASGEKHSCLLTEGGRVFCWGRNAEGQLGDGTTEQRSTPVPVELSPGVPLAGVRALALGFGRSCALVEGGEVLCWGSSLTSQLSAARQLNPVPVERSPGVRLRGVRAMALGRIHRCALVEGGEVLCWGNNYYGQLGDGTTTPRDTPAPVERSPGVRLTGVQALALGEDHGCALTEGGEVLCWGDNNANQLGDGTAIDRHNPVPVLRAPGQPLAGVRAVASGDHHACALAQGGEVLCWGFGNDGQLGDGAHSGRSHPVPVELSPGVPLTGAQGLALGGHHGCALVEGGELRCWGTNRYAQLGGGTSERLNYPVPVERSPGVRLAGVRGAAPGLEHSCALLANGEVRCWGRNVEGQLGDGTPLQRSTPAPVESSPGVPLAGAQTLALGWQHGCAVVAGGELHCWGSNNSGQLGVDYSMSVRNRPAPVELPSGAPLSGVLAVGLGGFHSCALVEGGEVRCWGSNLRGQLGTGHPTSHYSWPEPVELSPDVPLAGAQALAVGSQHGCVVVEGGELRCWGANDDGQLGDGTTAPRANPVPVERSPGVRLTGTQGLALGGNHSCAVVEGGEVLCWGDNGYGQLGDGTTEDRGHPVPVERSPGVRLTGALSLTLGWSHSCAVVEGGEVRCWGYNDSGQLGDGTTEGRGRPVPVERSPGVPLAGVRALALGVEHSCAVVEGGEVLCWGDNGYGQLGHGAAEGRSRPVSVELSPGVRLTGAQTLVLGNHHSCALTEGGATLCWGYNDDGQLGDGTAPYLSAPVRVAFPALP